MQSSGLSHINIAERDVTSRTNYIRHTFNIKL